MQGGYWSKQTLRLACLLFVQPVAPLTTSPLPLQTRIPLVPWPAQRIALQELGLSEAQLEERLAGVVNILPDLGPRLVSMQASTQLLVRLVANAEAVAARLVQIKLALPGVSACRQPCGEGGARPWVLCRGHSQTNAFLFTVRLQRVRRAHPSMPCLPLPPVCSAG